VTNSQTVNSRERYVYDAKSIKLLLHPFIRASLLQAIAILALDLALYGTALTVAVSSNIIAIKILCGCACGLLIGLVFIVGHDACHGSLTSSSRLNHFIGVLAFIPSAHAFSLWALGHNRIHHRYTNLKELDYVWRPFSKQEFDALPIHRRILERFYRTVPGHGLYYMYEIWWKKMFFPWFSELGDERKREHIIDSAVMMTGNVMILTSILLLAQWYHQPWLPTLLVAWLLPFLVWNWLMGFIIYQHHTHSSVAWFDDPKDWEYWESQIEGTTHIKFPRVFNFILHNIMEHTAHHALTGIPLYKLNRAQQQLEQILSPRMIVVRWTPRDYLRTVARCKLYDYPNHRWLDFKGRPMSDSPLTSKPQSATPTPTGA
jgi:omega-6 fatty acid desaturase (delta-12 desaturase)